MGLAREVARLTRVWHLQQVRIGMLHFGETLGGLHNLLKTVIVKLVGGGPSRAFPERGTNRN